MGKIRVMPESLSSKIAAGEVVERPLSIVKELIENSIDANSKNITIYFKNAGIDQIRIVDDGDGMDKDDVREAFIPHATSKIRNEYDLLRISTLGFRGEAIASISMVSKMSINSSTDGNGGFCVTYKGGEKISENITSMNKGTDIIVSDLFYNTPARLKFLKSPDKELSSNMFIINKIALAHPEITFKVISNDKTIFVAPGKNNLPNLISAIYGYKAAKELMIHNYSADGYNVKLAFLKPMFYRSSKLEITLICNGRYVRCYEITNAVIEAYQTFLPIGKSPIGIIYLDIDPLLIDCNVHPTKIEIKISNLSLIIEKLIEEIKLMLQNDYLIPQRNLLSNNNDEIIKIKEDENLIFDNTKIKVEPKEEKKEAKPYEALNIFDNNEDILSENNNLKDLLNNYQTQNIIKDNTKIEIEHQKLPYMEYIGTLAGTYLLFQNDNGLYLVDQHAACERWNYEKYHELLKNGKQPRTDLLIKDKLELTLSDYLIIKNHLDDFSNIGFEIELINEKEIYLKSIPLWAKDKDPLDIFYSLFEEINSEHAFDLSTFRDSMAKMMACKASIKANHQISKEEIKILMDNLSKCKNPYTCPHGRPTIINISLNEIEKMFERIQK